MDSCCFEYFEFGIENVNLEQQIKDLKYLERKLKLKAPNS